MRYFGCVVEISCVNSSSTPSSMPSLPLRSVGTAAGRAGSQPEVAGLALVLDWMCAVTTPSFVRKQDALARLRSAPTDPAVQKQPGFGQWWRRQAQAGSIDWATGQGQKPTGTARPGGEDDGDDRKDMAVLATRKRESRWQSIKQGRARLAAGTVSRFRWQGKTRALDGRSRTRWRKPFEAGLGFEAGRVANRSYSAGNLPNRGPRRRSTCRRDLPAIGALGGAWACCRVLPDARKSPLTRSPRAKPSSASPVVKELVENSLDAGASRIDVDIEGGGLSLVRVTDDGSGMSPQDAELCLLRHATSKLRSADDLFHLETMAFAARRWPRSPRCRGSA